MIKYRIAFIEDENSHIRSYKRKSDDVFDIVDIKLHTKLNDTISEIIDSKIHAVIIDFNLTKAQNIHYSGADIVDALEQRMPNFPIFVLTAYEDNAENKVYDVNKVYIKEKYLKNPDFLNNKINHQIYNFINEIRRKQETLDHLLKKQKENKLSLKEEEELIELDEYIESSFVGVSKIPRDLKKIRNAELLNKLIVDAEAVLGRIKK